MQEEIQSLIIQVANLMTVVGNLPETEVECAGILMHKFMNSHHQYMSKGDLTFAYKMCKRYAPCVMMREFIH